MQFIFRLKKSLLNHYTSIKKIIWIIFVFPINKNIFRNKMAINGSFSISKVSERSEIKCMNISI